MQHTPRSWRRWKAKRPELQDRGGRHSVARSGVDPQASPSVHLRANPVHAAGLSVDVELEASTVHIIVSRVTRLAATEGYDLEGDDRDEDDDPDPEDSGND